MKHTKKRVAALLLTLAMVLSLMPAAFAADTDFPDMPAEDDPSYAAVKSAVDNEIMTGENGQLNLEGTILRSTVSKMVVTAFAAKGEADLSSFGDVNSDAWYAEWMAKANQMGIMTGTSGMMRPGDEVTLQEVAAMLVRALGLEPGSAEDLEGVPGAEDVAEWAIPWVAALVKAEYISDVTGANQPMTRGAFAEVIYKVSGEGNYVNEGEITEDVDGNIVITSDGVSLKGITVKGDVIIADGVDAGSISLDGVTIEGRLVVRGGSSVELTNSTASATVIAKTFDEVTVKADNASDTGDIAVAGTNGKAADKVTLDMAEPNAVISTDTSVAIQNATGGTVSMESANVSVTVESGTLDEITVSDGMESAKIEVAEGATIENITTNTDITVTGEGTVSDVTGSGVVSDESGEVIGGGDEPAEVPTVSGGVAPAPTAPDQTAHVHNYATSDSNGDTPSITQLNATHHLVTCVTHTKNGDDDTQAITTGCGATITALHTIKDGVCTGCQYSQKVTPGEPNTENLKEGVEKACGEDGADYAEHQWVADTKSVENQPATCVASGVKAMVCDHCGATRNDTLPKLGHNYVLTENNPATCGAEGTQVYTCTVCADDVDEHQKAVTISNASVAHSYTTYTDVDGDCSSNELTRTWTCSVCSEGTEGHTKEEKIAKTYGHTSVTWELSEGKHVGTCSTCSEEVGAHAPAFAASWSSDAENHWHTCTVAGCTVKETEAHEYGEGTVCTVCAYPKPVEEETTGPAEHKHTADSAWSTNATHHWHACQDKDCPDSSAPAKLPGYAEHSYTGGGENQAGTCTCGAACSDASHAAATSAETKCSKCNYYKTETID